MLEARGLTVTYPDGPRIGPFDVVAGAGLTLLTGPSGCGKSTVIRCLAGIIPHVQPAAVEGRVRVEAVDPAGVEPAKRPGVVGWVPQELTTATPTPWEEVALPLEQMRLDPAETRRRVGAWLERFRLTDKAHEPIHTLSGGQRARVVAAAALAPGPKVLLLDEPLAQLDAQGRRGFLAALREAAPGGTTVLAATHRPELWPHGARRIALPAPPDSSAGVAEAAPAVTGPDVVRVEAATAKGRPMGPLSLRVAAGSASVLTGDNGAGKTTLLWLAAGLIKPTTGTVRLAGQDPCRMDAKARVEALGFAFQDPAWHVTQDTVWDEATLTLRRLGRDTAPARDWLERFGLRTLLARHPWDLSGGQRQRLAVVTALAHGPAVALLDEPTRGMDATHRDALVQAARDRSARGQATLVVTHDESLAAALGNRIPLEAPT